MTKSVEDGFAIRQPWASNFVKSYTFKVRCIRRNQILCRL